MVEDVLQLAAVGFDDPTRRRIFLRAGHENAIDSQFVMTSFDREVQHLRGVPGPSMLWGDVVADMSTGCQQCRRQPMPENDRSKVSVTIEVPTR